MHHPVRRFARALLTLSAALMLLLPAVPAVADGDDDHEVEVAGLELKAAPAVVKAGHPVLIKAKYDVDEPECPPAADAPADDPDAPAGDPDDPDGGDETVETLDAHETDDADDIDDADDADDVDEADEADEADDCDEADDADEAEDADDADGADDAEGADGGDETVETLDAHDTENTDGTDDADDADDADEADDADACTPEAPADGADDTDGTDGTDGTDETVESLSAHGQGQGRGKSAEAGQGRGRGGNACTSVEFVIDFGDGSEPQVVTGGGHPHKMKAKAHVRHVYAEEGDYAVTVTATPQGGTAVTATVTVQVGPGSARLSGRDRFETGTDLSEEAFPEDGSASAVVLARADGFADALASATLAALEDAPVLLTSTDQLPDSVLAEIKRVLAPGGTVYILGGTSAISDDVVTVLEGLGYTVERISGTDRVDTALAVAETLVAAGEDIDEVVLANADNFPDALSGAASAADRGAPVLLTPATVLDPRVREFLAGLPDGTTVLVAGGAKVISDEVIAELEALGLDVQRRSGKDRFATSAVIAAEEFPDATSVVIATGKTFPDALAGAAHAGRIKAPVLLVGDTLPEDVRAYLEAGAGRINLVYVLGGHSAVPAEVMAQIQAILGL